MTILKIAAHAYYISFKLDSERYATYHYVRIMRLMACLFEFNNKYINNVEASLHPSQKIDELTNLQYYYIEFHKSSFFLLA